MRSVLKTLLKAGLVGIIAIIVIAELVSGAKEPLRQKTPATSMEDLIFTANVYAVKRIRDSMKNPASFDLNEAIRLDDGTLCLTYRATNSFNAIVPGQAIVDDKATYTSDRGASFTTRWNRVCANKTGTDVKHIRTGLKFAR